MYFHYVRPQKHNATLRPGQITSTVKDNQISMNMVTTLDYVHLNVFFCVELAKGERNDRSQEILSSSLRAHERISEKSLPNFWDNLIWPCDCWRHSDLFQWNSSGPLVWAHVLALEIKASRTNIWLVRESGKGFTWFRRIAWKRSAFLTSIRKEISKLMFCISTIVRGNPVVCPRILAWCVCIVIRSCVWSRWKKSNSFLR